MGLGHKEAALKSLAAIATHPNGFHFINYLKPLSFEIPELFMDNWQGREEGLKLNPQFTVNLIYVL